MPFLAYPAVAAVAVALAAKGASGAAFAVLCVGVVIVFATDKIARPLLVGGAMKLGFLWVLLGSLGGFETLGLLGLFLGPAALALGGTLLREWGGGGGLPAAAGGIGVPGKLEGAAVPTPVLTKCLPDRHA